MITIGEALRDRTVAWPRQRGGRCTQCVDGLPSEPSGARHRIEGSWTNEANQIMNVSSQTMVTESRLGGAGASDSSTLRRVNWGVVCVLSCDVLGLWMCARLIASLR